MNGSPYVISVVAKSGSGKTTLIERILPVLKGRGLSVGVLKHHHHESSFDTPGKDTFRIAEAGADIVVGASPVQVAAFRRCDGSAHLDGVIDQYFAGLDLVLIEGYKRGSYPKIEVNRRARSSQLVCAPDEIIAVISDQWWELGVPCFSLNDIEAIASFIVDAADRSN